MSEHDTQQEFVALLALGALRENEAVVAHEHLAACPDCTREYGALREVSGCIGYAAEASERDASVRLSRVKRSLLASIGAHLRPILVTTGSRPAPNRPPALKPGGYTAWPLAFAFACIVIAAVTVSAFELREQTMQTRLALRASEHRAEVLAQAGQAAHVRLAEILAPNARRYAIPFGLLVQNRSRVLLVLQKLPPLPPGHVYQAWALPVHGKAMKAETTFLAGSGGTTIVRVPEEASGIAAIGVTIEPAGGSAAPTTKPIFVQLLS